MEPYWYTWKEFFLIFRHLTQIWALAKIYDDFSDLANVLSNIHQLKQYGNTFQMFVNTYEVAGVNISNMTD